MAIGLAEPVYVEVPHPIVTVVEFHLSTALTIDLELLITFLYDPVEIDLTSCSRGGDHQIPRAMSGETKIATFIQINFNNLVQWTKVTMN